MIKFQKNKIDSYNLVLAFSKARNPYARIRMRVRIRKISKSKDKQGGYPYIRIRERVRMIFKYTEMVCRKTHDVYANEYMES